MTDIQERRYPFIEVTGVWQEKPLIIGKMMISVARIQCVMEITNSTRTSIAFAGSDEDSIQVMESYHQVKDLIDGALREHDLSYADPGRNTYVPPKRP